MVGDEMDEAEDDFLIIFVWLVQGNSVNFLFCVQHFGESDK